MSELSKSVGARLKKARELANFKSASAFAEAHGIPISTYSQHETGKRVLSVETLMYYCRVLNVQPDFLLAGDGHIMPNETDLPVIDKRFVWVDTELLKRILHKMMPLWDDNQLDITKAELLDFIFDVYNGVVTISADFKAKLAMIELSVASLKRGMKKKIVHNEQVA